MKAVLLTLVALAAAMFNPLAMANNSTEGYCWDQRGDVCNIGSLEEKPTPTDEEVEVRQTAGYFWADSKGEAETTVVELAVNGTQGNCWDPEQICHPYFNSETAAK